MTKYKDVLNECDVFFKIRSDDFKFTIFSVYGRDVVDSVPASTLDSPTDYHSSIHNFSGLLIFCL